MDPRIIRYSERPDFWDDLGDLFDGVWPEYNQHGEELSHYWRQLYNVFPEWQFMLVGPGDEILAEGHTVPVAWDGTDRERDTGEYWEPNVWIVHQAGPSPGRQPPR